MCTKPCLPECKKVENLPWRRLIRVVIDVRIHTFAEAKEEEEETTKESSKESDVVHSAAMSKTLKVRVCVFETMFVYMYVCVRWCPKVYVCMHTHRLMSGHLYTLLHTHTHTIFLSYIMHLKLMLRMMNQGTVDDSKHAYIHTLTLPL